MNKNIVIGVVAIIVVIIAGAYVMSRSSMTGEYAAPEQNGGVTNQMPAGSGENALPVEPAAALARTDLATKLGVDEKSIVILLIEEKEWTDGCLGLGGPAESCLQALVPGYRIELQAEGKVYVYRTDKTGGSLRMDTSATTTGTPVSI